MAPLPTIRMSKFESDFHLVNSDPYDLAMARNVRSVAVDGDNKQSHEPVAYRDLCNLSTQRLPTKRLHAYT